MTIENRLINSHDIECLGIDARGDTVLEDSVTIIVKAYESGRTDVLCPYIESSFGKCKAAERELKQGENGMCLYQSR